MTDVRAAIDEVTLVEIGDEINNAVNHNVVVSVRHSVSAAVNVAVIGVGTEVLVAIHEVVRETQ